MSDDETNAAFWLAILSLCDQATRDPLTGLRNRRFFEETLADHVAAAQRYDRALSLVLFDLDDFKKINDARGHAAGDRALKHFADVLESTARAADLIFRHGGDEFAVLLPETDLASARKFVERVGTKQTHPTVTAGLASLPSADLAAEADAELVSRKKQGKGKSS